MKKVPVGNNLEEFQLSDDVAGGSKLPYSGYVEVEIQIPFIQNGPICIPILVVPKSDLSDRVPVIFGFPFRQSCTHLGLPSTASLVCLQQRLLPV
jgi:hypothetical protein